MVTETGNDGERNWRQAETQDSLQSIDIVANKRVVALTILCHPILARIGDVSRLSQMLVGRPCALSRLEPIFASPGASQGESLADARISRRPIWIQAAAAGGVRLDCRETSTLVVADGEAVSGEMTVSAARVDSGVVVELGRHFVVLLHRVSGVWAADRPTQGLVGESAGIQRLRDDIHKVYDIQVPVLLRGESGTGKELVAQAVHAASPRSGRPFVPVNMAAITPTTAASELFGHVRGAFTGASRDHVGYFGQADGGTLFLDEVGETPPELQAMLLRALETSEIHPVGGAKRVGVDVRIIAATDADLESAARAGTFKVPLLHRLAGYEIHVPALRDRKDDIARLMMHFLALELAQVGGSSRLTDDASFLSAELVAKLVRYSWPGNVRQLRNIVRQLVISSRGSEVLVLDPAVERLLDPPTDSVPEPVTVTAGELTEASLISELRRNRFRLGPTASALGISRTTLYAHIDKSDKIRKARDLQPAEIGAALERSNQDVDHAALALEVSKRGLQLRIRELDS
ncbi:MAG: two-component system nitrogen regulation response regulator GlnG [Myxococcota bacterium]